MFDHSDAGRKKEITNKLAQLAQRLGKVGICVDALRSQQEALQGDSEGLTDTWRRIASVLSTQQTLTDQQSIQVRSATIKIVMNMHGYIYRMYSIQAI